MSRVEPRAAGRVRRRRVATSWTTSSTGSAGSTCSRPSRSGSLGVAVQAGLAATARARRRPGGRGRRARRRSDSASCDAPSVVASVRVASSWRRTCASSCRSRGTTARPASTSPTSSRRATSGCSEPSSDSTPTFGVRFSTYATYWIRQAVRHGMSKMGHAIALPDEKRALLARGPSRRRASDPGARPVARARRRSPPSWASPSTRSTSSDVPSCASSPPTSPIGEEGETELLELLTTADEPGDDAVDRSGAERRARRGDGRTAAA